MNLVKPLTHASQSTGPSKHQVETYPHNREHQNQNNPGYFICRINLQSIHPKNQQQTQNTRQCRYCSIIIRQFHCHSNNPGYLKQYTDNNHHQSFHTVFCILFCLFCLFFSAVSHFFTSSLSVYNFSGHIYSLPSPITYSPLCLLSRFSSNSTSML